MSPRARISINSKKFLQLEPVRFDTSSIVREQNKTKGCANTCWVTRGRRIKIARVNNMLFGRKHSLQAARCSRNENPRVDQYPVTLTLEATRTKTGCHGNRPAVTLILINQKGPVAMATDRRLELAVTLILSNQRRDRLPWQLTSC